MTSTGVHTIAALPEFGLQLQSLLTNSGELELSLRSTPVRAPAADEVVVRVEAAPVNPSDLGNLVGAADIATAKSHGHGASRRTTLRVPETAHSAMSDRLGQSLAVGNEGAGVVIATGDRARQLLGKRVALLSVGMYSEYRTVGAHNCLVLPDDVSSRAGSSSFVNPLTALGMVETMRKEGHTALVHTAAASNLGRMLVKICEADHVPLVNIVRSAEQVDLLKSLGARHVYDSSAPGFTAALVDAMSETGATIAFDAIAGGRMASKILSAMEAAARRSMTGYAGYGSSVFKQVYLYGGLDPRPTELTRGFGMAWNIGGWLLANFLQKLEASRAGELRQRVVSEIGTTFASNFTKTVSLSEILNPEVLRAIARRSTGEKYLVTPAIDTSWSTANS